MARINIAMPANFIATLQIPVRITDINYGNHVGNDAFVALIHEARMQWLQQHGHTELAVAGTGLIMSDLLVQFRNESFYGDHVEVNIAVAEITRVSFELCYQLMTMRNEEKILLALARTTMVCYDYPRKKVVAIPDQLLALLHA